MSIKKASLFPCLLLLTLIGCAPKAEQKTVLEEAPKRTASEKDISVGGRKLVELTQPESKDRGKPQILSVQVLPGRGMDIYQIKAFVPGKGVIDVLESDPIEQMAPKMTGTGEDANGVLDYHGGGAILVPYANRIRGKLSKDKQTITADILGKKVTLPANSKGKKPGAEPHAMHGLILARAADTVDTKATSNESTVTGVFDAGDFDGHWFSKTNATISVVLKDHALQLKIEAKNTGDQDLPMGIGWHPYFKLPSGQREQAKLRIPATERAEVNNYDDVFPTGKLLKLEGTPFDFTDPKGSPLNKTFLDDCFVGLKRDAEAHVAVDLIDPAANYGVRVKGLSSDISAYQVYAPVEKQFVVIEPQFNWGDPFSKVWKGKKTGIVMLKPGQSVTYLAELSLFVP